MAEKSPTQKMTSGNSLREIVAFFFPLLCGNLCQQIYNLVDSIVVGKGIGDAALAAVGSTGIINFLILGFAQGLTRGFCIAFAQSFGGEDYEDLRSKLYHSVILSALISIILTVFCLLTIRPLMVLMGTPADILEDALAYFRIILLGIAVTVFNNLAIGLLQSLGNSRTPLMAMIISSVSNIVMDILFVIFCHWGVAGAAAATVLAQFFSLLLCVRSLLQVGILRNTEAANRPAPGNRFRWAEAAALIRIGLPVALMNSVTALGGMILQTFVNNMGTDFVAAYSVSEKYATLFETFGGAVGLTMLTFVGQNYGAHEFLRIRKGVREGLLLATLVNISLASGEIFIPDKLASLMVSSPAVIAHCCEFMPILGICIFPLGWLFVYRFSCQAMGNTTLPMYSGMLEIVCRLVFGFLLMATFRGIALAEVSAWIGAMFMNAGGYYRMLGKADGRAAGSIAGR